MKLLKKHFLRYLWLTVANFLAAFSFNFFIKPINLVAGGTPGLALVLSNAFGISTTTVVTVMYIITFVFGLIFLSKSSIVGIIYASVTYPIFVYLTENITDILVINYSDLFLITVIAACISGITNGLIFKNGFASSGVAIFAPIIHKYFKISISLANFLINATIVLFGGYFFGFNIVLYAIIYLYVSNYICNIIILGVSYNKVLFIYSKKLSEIIELLKNKYKISATIFNEKDNHKLAMIVVKNNYYTSLKDDLVKIDHDVFFTTNQCYEVTKK